MAAASVNGLSMSNYQLGESLGKGASAQVYKALNWTSGETVAIKQIQLRDIPAAELGDIMSEIDLLKNLNHVNIVKYKGFFKSAEFLYIILEYCENGSLQTISKRYGKFPEDLVAVYISQVLEGLVYLHSQGVIHRDIKGANILTNKDGGVKLADFGVSTMMPGAIGIDGKVIRGTNGEAGSGGDESVVGSPYWMAPEIIEQSGASTASDIWSVGCVVIELLEGKPPYHALEPLQALFRIVQDDGPPIPDGASPIVKDFLYQCFQKDPNLRITAKKLCKHPWMSTARRQIEMSAPQPEASSSRPSIAASTSSREPSESGSAGQESERATMGKGVKRIRSIKRVMKPSDILEVGKDGRSGGESERRSRVRQGDSGEFVRSKDKGKEKEVVQPEQQEKEKDGSTTIKLNRRPLTTVYDQAVQRVQEWNEALKAAPKLPQSSKNLRRIPNLYANIYPKPRRTSTSLVDNSIQASSSGESFAAHINAVNGTSQMVRHAMPTSRDVVQALARAEEAAEDASIWDDDFVEGPDLQKLANGRAAILNPPGPTPNGKVLDDGDNMKTIMPGKSPKTPTSPRPLDGRPSSRQTAQRISEDDYSDMTLDLDDGFEEKIASLKEKNGLRKGVYHPSDIRTNGLNGVLTSGMPSIRRRDSGGPINALRLGLVSPVSSNGLPTRSPSRQSSFRFASPDEKEKLKALKKYAERDEEDVYDDVFEATQSADATQGAATPTTSEMLRLNTRRSDKSWLMDDDNDETDPFAEFEDGFEANDAEANLLRDKHAMLCATINSHIQQLRPNETEATLQASCEELLRLLDGAVELQDHFVTAHGMLAVLEVLEARPSRHVILTLLRIINSIIMSDLGLLESCCHVGGIPVVMTFTSKKYSLEIRLEASTFVRCLTSSALTLQMFISCRGLRVLVELLDEDYGMNKDLVLSALEGIGSVFELQSATPRNDFCRMFIREGISDPLSTALIHIVKDRSTELAQSKYQIVTIMFLFCQTAQSDTRVQEAFATRSFALRVLKACDYLEEDLLITALKAIKHLSTAPKMIEVLQNSDAITVLVRMLDKYVRKPSGNEICSHIFQSLFNLCRLSRSRQEEAAQAGIIPVLKHVIEHNSPVKEFALPILCDLANAGKVSRRLLWKADGVQIYLSLLPDSNWRLSALESILSWLQDETAAVEDQLLQPSAIESITLAFTKATGPSFEGILEPLLKVLRTSAAITKAIAQPAFFKHLVDSLSKKAKATTKLSLLKIIRVVCDSHPERAHLVQRFGLAAVVDKLIKQDEAVLVRELAKEIVPSLLPAPPPPSREMLPPASTSRPAVRRAASESPMAALATKSDKDKDKKDKKKLSRNRLNDIHWAEKNGKTVAVSVPKAAPL